LGWLLGQVLSRRREARALLISTVAAEEETLGASHEETARTRKRLQDVQCAMSDTADGDQVAADDGQEGTVVAHLLHIVTAPQYRRRGAARAALSVLVEKAWAAGAQAVEAHVPRAKAEGAPWSLVMSDAGFQQIEVADVRGIEHARFRLVHTI
jgi:GNAT superfamily N-acetyltransferase